VIRKREIWEGRYHEASGFSCLVDVGLQEWQAWQGSGRVFEDRGDYHHCGYCYCCHTPVARGGIGEIVSLSQAQGCTRNAMTTSVAAVIRYQEWLTVAQQSGVCEKEGEGKCGGMYEGDTTSVPSWFSFRCYCKRWFYRKPPEQEMCCACGDQTYMSVAEMQCKK
jgi:hypothetical protein